MFSIFSSYETEDAMFSVQRNIAPEYLLNKHRDDIWYTMGHVYQTGVVRIIFGEGNFGKQ